MAAAHAAQQEEQQQQQDDLQEYGLRMKWPQFQSSLSQVQPCMLWRPDSCCSDSLKGWQCRPKSQPITASEQRLLACLQSRCQQ